jgi:hypothetical protein
MGENPHLPSSGLHLINLFIQSIKTNVDIEKKSLKDVNSYKLYELAYYEIFLNLSWLAESSCKTSPGHEVINLFSEFYLKSQDFHWSMYVLWQFLTNNIHKI